MELVEKFPFKLFFLTEIFAQNERLGKILISCEIFWGLFMKNWKSKNPLGFEHYSVSSWETGKVLQNILKNILKKFHKTQSVFFSIHAST